MTSPFMKYYFNMKINKDFKIFFQKYIKHHQMDKMLLVNQSMLLLLFVKF